MSLVANVPCTLFPQSVPVSAQHALPAFLPEFVPSIFVSRVAGQIPSSATFDPPGSLPHFLNSQQFCFFMIMYPLFCRFIIYSRILDNYES